MWTVENWGPGEWDIKLFGVRRGLILIPVFALVYPVEYIKDCPVSRLQIFVFFSPREYFCVTYAACIEWSIFIDIAS